ncbi:esterase-like activity of phytase family protein [Leptolyngbya sp. FACHB-261]|uniref:esterase-like activity of phytase family protein n=1 Tax=Leptolyngbya sp. FACHB-261 TaxID=2692806 RepID=UPI001683D403|nr:esterase-like activity of phytase family protein [Leptolyngbya sp. FACHB-261]MBD2101848.1 esterase-like activity of phytase family protein [Leptolyngbya sp. FACHB-261]
MHRLLTLVGLTGLLAIAWAISGQQVQGQAQANLGEPTILGRYSLNPVALKAAQERAWPGQVRDDRGLQLGGLFSGLHHMSGDPENTFYAVADRGPNGQVRVGEDRRRTFPVPEYSPVIYKLRTVGDQLQIIGQTIIRTRSGQPVTGISNTEADETPYSFDGQTRLALNPNGLDIEGLARAQDGSFWVCDEYSPSLAQIAPNGTVLYRLVPGGLTLTADTDVRAVLPAIYSKRRGNRGFEGLTLSRDGSRIFAVLQSPLDFPTKDIGRASRMIRLLVVDTRSLRPVAEYVYVAEPSRTFREADQGEMKLSDVAFVNPTTLLVDERTDKVAHIYQIDLSRATNILGSRWSDLQNTGNSLEALTPAQLAENNITPVGKTLLVDLSKLPNMPDKIEGLTVVDANTIAVGNDNDFGFDRFTPQGRAVNNSLSNLLLTIRLPRALPLAR